LLLLAVGLAAALRFYRLGEWPPGPYRDEAYNALDALDVLRGQHALFFPANNGREPFYIYLVALSIALFGPTTLALRLPAAVVGTLTTLPVWLLGRAWFGRAAGLLAAILWAITLWPVHLGRIGLRAGLLAPLLALAFWLGTRAYRERRATLWLAAGLVYGLSFYTYLAARFTPLLLALFAVYLVATGRRARLWDSGRVLWFVGGAALVVAPLAAVLLRQPELLLGRAGQVSILSPEVNGGEPLRALLGNASRALGLYVWRGDAILRHNALLGYDVVLKADNPAGRPLFDLFMAGPFLVGLGWCVWRWRRPAAAFLLLWQLVMLGPTILAEDAPHFLRAAGILPGAVFFPAIGLALLWQWPRLPALLRRAAVILLLAGSLALTIRDYARYAQQPDVAYLWESAAAELANAARATPPGTAVYLDQRFVEGWPSVPFLLGDRPVSSFDAANPPATITGPAVVFAWPYDPLDALAAAVVAPARVAVEPGPLARGDLEPQAYPLYTRYTITPGTTGAPPAANFDNRFHLMAATVTQPAPDAVTIDLEWATDAARPTSESLPQLFIHVTGPEGMLAQHDGALGRGLWPVSGWRPLLRIAERHTLALPRPFDPATDTITAGLYDPTSGRRLPLTDDGAPPGDAFVLPPGE
jgi:4-amino-4-deoxy-L-arabinose transferase-like glycosyltransferase